MQLIDLRTLLLVTGAMGALMAIVLAVLRSTYPRSIQGLGAWSLGLASIFVSTLLFGGRGVISDALSIILANLLGFGGYAYLYVGTQRFFGVPASLLRWFLLALAMAPVLAWFTYHQPHFGVRMAVMAALMAWVSVLHCRLVWWHRPAGFPGALLIGTLGAQALSQGGRLVAALTSPTAEALFGRSTSQSLYLTAYALSILILCIGFVLLANDKLLVEFRRLAGQEATELSRETQRLTELNALKNQFIANVSHELRTPLTLVVGPLDDLARDLRALNPASAQRLDLVQRNAKWLQGLVEELLDVTRLESGGVRLRVRRVELSAFVRHACERFCQEAERRGVTIDTGSLDSAVAVYCDVGLLEKVLSNLLGNALKFTPSGGAVRVALEVPTDVIEDGSSVRVWVRDTGIGIARAEAVRVFERFYQTDDCRSSRSAGSGIGLSLARGLVELHGGEMGLADDAGPGAAFWFTLPLGSAHFAPEDMDVGPVRTGDALPPAAGLPAENAEELGLPLILLVEDHPDMRDYLASHLVAVGRVVAAQDGATALRLAHELRPQLIVSDVMMPEMDGIELAWAVRDAPSLAATRVLLVTAKGDPQERAQGLTVADDYLAKPFHVPELLARCRNLLRPQRALQAADAPDPAIPEAPAGLTDSDQRFVERLRAAVVERMADSSQAVPAVAKRVGLSPRQLQRRCREVTGQGPIEFMRHVRMTEAEAMMARGTFKTVAEVAAAVGMSPTYFGRLWGAWHGGKASTQLRSRGGAGDPPP